MICCGQCAPQTRTAAAILRQHQRIDGLRRQRRRHSGIVGVSGTIHGLQRASAIEVRLVSAQCILMRVWRLEIIEETEARPQRLIAHDEAVIGCAVEVRIRREASGVAVRQQRHFAISNTIHFKEDALIRCDVVGDKGTQINVHRRVLARGGCRCGEHGLGIHHDWPQIGASISLGISGCDGDVHRATHGAGGRRGHCAGGASAKGDAGIGNDGLIGRGAGQRERRDGRVSVCQRQWYGPGAGALVGEARFQRSGEDRCAGWREKILPRLARTHGHRIGEAAGHKTCTRLSGCECVAASRQSGDGISAIPIRRGALRG